LSKACLKDDNDPKFVSGGKLFHVLNDTLYTETPMNWDLNNLYA